MRVLIIALVSLAMAVETAMAQDTSSQSTANTTSTASSSSGNEVGASQSRSTSTGGTGTGGNGTAIFNYTTPAPIISNVGSASDPATSNNNVNYSGSTTTNSNVHYSGSQTIKDVPAQATLIETPTAPCMVPIGGTFSVAGFGGGAVGAYTSQECETLERIRMTWNMDQHDVANQMMCQFSDYRNARETVGEPCPPVITRTVQTAQISTTVDNSAAVSTVERTSNTQSAKTVAIVTTKPPSQPSPRDQFCNSLNPLVAEDQPYIQYECKNQ